MNSGIQPKLGPQMRESLRIFGWFRRSPPRQVRRKIPSAMDGSSPK
jgi:hypothetical protein